MCSSLWCRSRSMLNVLYLCKHSQLHEYHSNLYFYEMVARNRAAFHPRATLLVLLLMNQITKPKPAHFVS